MTEAKKLTGGMDTDSSIESIAPNDYIESWNTRNTGTSIGERTDNTDMDSTVEILTTRPILGVNKGHGSEGFDRIRKGFTVIFNTEGFHQIDAV